MAEVNGYSTGESLKSLMGKILEQVKVHVFIRKITKIVHLVTKMNNASAQISLIISWIKYKRD